MMRFLELLLGAGMKGAEIGMVSLTEHAATATVSEGELTGVRFGGVFGFHRSSGFGEAKK